MRRGSTVEVDGIRAKVVSIDRDPRPVSFWFAKTPPVWWITVEYPDGVRKTVGSQRVKEVTK